MPEFTNILSHIWVLCRYDMVFEEDQSEIGERKKQRVHKDSTREDRVKRDSDRGHHKSRYNEEERDRKSRDRGEDGDHRRKESRGRDYGSRDRDEGGDRRRDEREERDYRKGSGLRDRYKHHEGHRHKRDYDEMSRRDGGARDYRR